MTSLLRHPRRVWRVAFVLIRLLVAPALHLPGADKRSGPVRLRVAFESLGGAWIKLGQMLALRYDLLPVPYCDELFKLLNQVAPFSYEEVRRIVRQELGGEPEQVFRSFEHQSFAAASIGQVHRAVLHNGDRVAVKVQRPGIRETLHADIELMYSTSWLIDRAHIFGATGTRQVIEEFARWTADELDYLVEARQAVLLWEHADGARGERIARVYRDYTTSRVLTTEMIEGISLYDVMVAKREGDQVFLDAFRAAGHDLDRIVRHLDWNMLNQVYVFGYFHADLHPANLFVLPGDTIGYVDFGIVGQLPDRVRDSLAQYSWWLFRGEVETSVRELMRWLAPGSSTDIEAARRQLIRVHQAFLYSTVGEGARVTRGAPGPAAQTIDNPYSRLAVDILDCIRQHELTLSSSIVAYLKMLVTLGTLRHQLSDDYDLAETVRSFVRKLARQRGMDWLDPRKAVDRIIGGTARVHRALDFLEFIESQESFLVEAQTQLFGFQKGLRNAKRRLITLGVAVLAVGGLLYLVAAFPTEAREVVPREVPITWVHVALLVVLLFLVMSIINHMRRLGPQR